ncbi:hypothetical protein DSO57_1017881 [Entomophthora muscae]|uniref:Uncharacterized protein n=1 Tax=Entomophthora muscae TaxID=34485 RepID=A0ACC2UE87_9FUNG|nr:hypothetical protein DSO57_1017881 [Entomophthora muscae]
MILPILKFVVFSVAPFFLLLWLTSPDLWSKISSSARLVGDNPSSLLNLSSSLLFLGEAVVKILTCDDLDLDTEDYSSRALVSKEILVSLSSALGKSSSVPLHAASMPSLVPSHTPWLLTGLVLMGLNVYFPQLSHASSLWSPLQVAIPVLHWVASWWIVSPGWEPNLVSLAPLSHINNIMDSCSSVLDSRSSVLGSSSLS